MWSFFGVSQNVSAVLLLHTGADGKVAEITPSVHEEKSPTANVAGSSTSVTVSPPVDPHFNRQTTAERGVFSKVFFRMYFLILIA